MKNQYEINSCHGPIGCFGAIHTIVNNDHLLAKIINEKPDGHFAHMSNTRQAYCVYREIYAYYKMNALKDWCYDSDKGHYCLIIQKFPGVTVKEFIDRNKYVKLIKVKEIIEPIDRCLTDFYSKTSLVHHDLHNQNVLYDEKSKTARVIDFGYSRYSGHPGQYLERLVSFQQFLLQQIISEPFTFQIEVQKEYLLKIKNNGEYLKIINNIFFIFSCFFRKATTINPLLSKGMFSFFIGELALSLGCGLQFALNQLYRNLDCSKNKSFLVGAIIACTALYMGLTALAIYTLSALLLNPLTWNTLISLSSSKWAFLVYPAFACVTGKGVYAISQMLKTCYGLGEEFIDSFIMPKTFIHKKIEFFVKKQFNSESEPASHPDLLPQKGIPKPFMPGQEQPRLSNERANIAAAFA
jgi:serine/threonine protein kinase